MYGGTCSGSAGSGQYGTFPGSGNEYGYGGGISYNFNYNQNGKIAQQSRLTLSSPASNIKVHCDECYAHLGAGMGFEFQTEAFDYYPSYLIYMRAWADAIATYSFNGVLETTSAAAVNQDGTSQNILLNGRNGPEFNQNFREGSITDVNVAGHNAGQGYLKKFYFSVAGIPTEIGIKIPVFASWGVNTNSAGRASKYSFYYAKEEYGIAYLNPSHRAKCTMPYCNGLRQGSSCDSSGFCKISVSERREGGEDPVWTFPAGTNTHVTFNLHPVVIICLWPSLGCEVSAFIEPKITVAVEFRGVSRRSLELENRLAVLQEDSSLAKDDMDEKTFQSRKLVHQSRLIPSHTEKGAARLRSCRCKDYSVSTCMYMGGDCSSYQSTCEEKQCTWTAGTFGGTCSGSSCYISCNEIAVKVKVHVYAWAHLKWTIGIAGYKYEIMSLTSPILHVYVGSDWILWIGCATSTPTPAKLAGTLCGVPQAAGDSQSGTSSGAVGGAGKAVSAGSRMCTQPPSARRAISAESCANVLWWGGSRSSAG